MALSSLKLRATYVAQELVLAVKIQQLPNFWLGPGECQGLATQINWLASSPLLAHSARHQTASRKCVVARFVPDSVNPLIVEVTSRP